ncbi:MAG: HNH endonuclease [Patescibacteria group bacterium]|nr:HNH endonuclease [Patescibacteria group bacterium]
MQIVSHLIGAAQGKHPISARRSDKWPAVRRHHLEAHPTCAVCGGKDSLEVHHKKPFHLHPELELDPDNLITLCESKNNGVNCHLLVGHLGNFRSLNEDVEPDSATWNQKIRNRP